MASIFKYKAGSHIDWVGGRTLTPTAGNVTGSVPRSRWHVGIINDTNAIVKVGTAYLIGGGSHDSIAPGTGIKFTYRHGNGIDFSNASFSGAAIRLSPNQTITDGVVTTTLGELMARIQQLENKLK